MKGDLVLKEHKAAMWLDEESISSVNWLPADKELVNKVKNEI